MMDEIKRFEVIVLTKRTGRKKIFPILAKDNEEALMKFKFRHGHRLNSVEVLKVKGDMLNA